MSTLTIKTCYCQRDFVVEGSRCPEHCSPICCRAYACERAKPPTRRPEARTRTCVVCGRSNARFKFDKFAPCDENCARFFSHTPGPHANGYPRGWHCEGVFSDPSDLMARGHRPAGKPRVHIKYCSLRCFYSERGHEARKRAGANRRSRRYWEKDGGSKNAYLRSRREMGALPPRKRPPVTTREWEDRYRNRQLEYLTELRDQTTGLPEE